MLYYKNDCREGESKMEGKNKEILDKNIISIFEQIKTDIFQTRGKVLSDANKELLSMYFRIGKIIAENS